MNNSVINPQPADIWRQAILPVDATIQQAIRNLDEVAIRIVLVVPPKVAREVVLQLMQSNDVQQVPIVDEPQRLVGRHLWHTINAPTVRTSRMLSWLAGWARACGRTPKLSRSHFSRFLENPWSSTFLSALASKASATLRWRFIT